VRRAIAPRTGSSERTYGSAPVAPGVRGLAPTAVYQVLSPGRRGRRIHERAVTPLLRGLR